jgi:hypothetical protein
VCCIKFRLIESFRSFPVAPPHRQARRSNMQPKNLAAVPIEFRGL